MRHDISSLAERPEIVTENLLLRRPDERDLAAIVDIVGNRVVARRLSRVPHPYTLADAAFFLEHVVPGEWVWAITQPGADTMIGAVGLTPNDGGLTAELGYWLSPACWGRGLMTEAATAVLTYGFNTLALRGVTSGYFEENPASGRVLAKLGFVVTGHGIRPCLATGDEVPSVELQLAAPMAAGPSMTA